MKSSIYLIFIAMLFITILMTANHMATKLISIFGFTIGAGVLVFPQSYILANITTEVYGYKWVRFMTWASVILALFIVFWREVSVYLQLTTDIGIDIQAKQEAYDLITSLSEGANRAMLSSILSYGVSELINSMFISKMKIFLKGKWFWLRATTSTIIALLVGTGIYNIAMFWGVSDLGLMIKMSLFSFFFSIALEQILMPVSWMIINILKEKEGIDVYDYHTTYNPFSLNTEYSTEELQGKNLIGPAVPRFN